MHPDRQAGQVCQNQQQVVSCYRASGSVVYEPVRVNLHGNRLLCQRREEEEQRRRETKSLAVTLETRHPIVTG